MTAPRQKGARPIEVYIQPRAEAGACQVAHSTTRLSDDKRDLIYDHDEVFSIDVHGGNITVGIRLCRAHAALLYVELKEALR